jgi:protein-S-isoprenylcysteine O-methyltransferase Ste14
VIQRKGLVRAALVISGAILVVTSTSSHPPEWARIFGFVWGGLTLAASAFAIISGGHWVTQRIRRGSRR